MSFKRGSTVFFTLCTPNNSSSQKASSPSFRKLPNRSCPKKVEQFHRHSSNLFWQSMIASLVPREMARMAPMSSPCCRQMEVCSGVRVPEALSSWQVSHLGFRLRPQSDTPRDLCVCVCVPGDVPFRLLKNIHPR